MSCRRFALLIVFFSASLQAGGLHEMARILGQASIGLIKGRPAGEKEYPEALSMVWEKGGLASKCSPVAFGRCALAAGHCFQKGFSSAVIRGTNFQTKFVPGQLALHDDWKWKFGGADIGIARMEEAPAGYLTPDDIADPSLLPEVKVPARITGEEEKKLGVAVAVAGYGHTENALGDGKTEYTLEEQEAQRARAIQETLHPEKQVGDLRYLGTIGPMLIGDSLDKIDRLIKRAKKPIAAATQANLDAAIAKIKKVRDTYASFVFLPDPSEVAIGDSGGGVYITQKGQRKLLSVNGSQIKEVQDESGNAIPNPVFDDLVRQKASVGANLPLHREWIQKQWDKLGCDPKAKPKDSM